MSGRKNFLEFICSIGKLSYLSVMKHEKRKSGPVSEPTKSELEILQVLWLHGPKTVRFVNDRLNEDKREVQYASTLKLMQIMAEKGLLLRDDGQVKHIYTPATEEGKTKSALLDRFVDSLFDGSVSNLMQHLLDHKKASQQELDEIRALLNASKKNKS
jgi:BlaI family penicillinase repressor